MSTSNLIQPICSNCNFIISFGPVWLTASGKNYCGRCQLKSHEKYTRNKIYEGLLRVSKHEFQCKNEIQGCKERFISKRMKNHEAICKYSKYECPAESDQWEGKFEEIEEHFKIQHQELIIQNPMNQKPDLTTDFEKKFFLVWKGFFFVVQQSYDTIGQKLKHNVLLIGAEEIATLFRYNVVFSMKKNNNEKREVMKNKPVQLYKKGEMDDADCIDNSIEILEEELDKYENLEFSLRYEILIFLYLLPTAYYNRDVM